MSRYTAFISYRHGGEDGAWARRLHRELERYRTPGALVREGKPIRLGAVFRDEDELPAHSDLNEALRGALRESAWLIVICSLRSRASKYVEQEVAYFRELGRDNRILLLLIEGEPAEAFPAALRASADGTLPALEPLAADARALPGTSASAAARDAIVRIQAALLGVGYDALKQREAARRRMRRAATGALCMLGLILLATAGVFGVRAIDASRLKAQAERATAQIHSGKPAGMIVVEGLRRAVTLLDGMTLDPRVEASVRHSLGEEFSRYGENDLALPLFRRAYELRRQRDDRVLMHESGLGYAQSLWESGCVDEARRLAEEACSYFESHPRAAGDRLWRARLYRASALKRSREYQHASGEYQSIIDCYGKEDGPSLPVMLTAQYDLALCIQARADDMLGVKDPPAPREELARMYRRAIELMNQARDRRLVSEGRDSADAILINAEMARVHRRLSGVLGEMQDEPGRHEHHTRAVSLYEEAMPEMIRVFGEKSWRLAQTRANLGTAHLRGGRPERAVPLYKRALERYNDPDMRGAWHAQTLTVTTYLSEALEKSDQRDEARAVLAHQAGLIAQSAPKNVPCNTGVVNPLMIEKFANTLVKTQLQAEAEAVRTWLKSLDARLFIQSTSD